MVLNCEVKPCSLNRDHENTFLMHFKLLQSYEPQQILRLAATFTTSGGSQSKPCVLQLEAVNFQVNANLWLKSMFSLSL